MRQRTNGRITDKAADIPSQVSTCDELTAPSGKEFPASCYNRGFAPFGEDKGKLSADKVSESQEGGLLLTRVVCPDLSTWNLFYRTDLRLKAQQCRMESLV